MTSGLSNYAGYTAYKIEESEAEFEIIEVAAAEDLAKHFGLTIDWIEESEYGVTVNYIGTPKKLTALANYLNN